MSEGYLIVNCSMKNLTQVELLIKSIRLHDPSRPISIIAHEKNLSSYILYVDNEIYIDKKRKGESTLYFDSLLASPYEKTIAFEPDQLLTEFNPAVWENLRGMNCIVIPKTRFNFDNTELKHDKFTKTLVENKSFNTDSCLNAIYFNRTKGCDYVFGLAALIAGHYTQHEFVDFAGSLPNNALPNFPENIWPAWIMSLLSKVVEFKIAKFDFIKCIDFSPRDNDIASANWTTKKWTEFLTYWVNDTGSIKVENFVQQGLIKYSTSAWLNEQTLTNLRKKYI